MPVSRLHDRWKLIEPKKEIKVTAKSRISQFAGFARMIMNRYLVKSVYEFSSASFVFADWFHEDQEAEERQRQEREILRLLAAVRDFQREKQLPAVYNQLIQQINQTVTVYENRLGEKSGDLLFLCREVSRQREKASEYLQEPETERRFARLVMQLADPEAAALWDAPSRFAALGLAAPEKMLSESKVSNRMKPEQPKAAHTAHTKVFTGRFHAGLENRVRMAGRIPSYTERFLNAKKESTECFRQVFTERLPLIRFVESLSREEKEQIQKLFPEFFTEHQDMVHVLSSMPRTRWTEWKKQVVEMAFPGTEHLLAQMGTYGEKTEQFMEEDFVDHVSAREQEQAAGKLAFLSVFSGTGEPEQILETILNDTETEWERTERIFLEISGEEKIRKLQKIYREEKRMFLEQIQAGKPQNLFRDWLAFEFAREVLKLEVNRSAGTVNLERPEEGVRNDAAVMDKLLRTVSLQKKGRERKEQTPKADHTELTGRTELEDRTERKGHTELTDRTELSGRAESVGRTELLGRAESVSRTELTGRAESVSRTGLADQTKITGRAEPASYTESEDRTAREALTELLKEMAEFAQKPDTGVTGEKSAGWEKDNNADAGIKEKPDAGWSGQGEPEQKTVPGVGMAAGKLALMMTVSELGGGGEDGLSHIIPELTEILNCSEESWEKAQTVLLHSKDKETETGIARGPGASYRDWKHSLSQAAGLETEKETNRNSQLLLSAMREIMKEKEFRFLTEKVMIQARLLPERWENLTHEQKIMQLWPQMKGDSQQEEGKGARAQKEGEIRGRPEEAAVGQDAERELSRREIFENPEGKKAAAKIQLLERIVQVQKEQKLWERIQREYSSERKEYVQKLQEQNGTVPKEMRPVLGKGPFLSMMERQEEAPEMVAGLFYEIPELKIYARGLAEETDRGKKREHLREVIASLDVNEWKLLEHKVFEKSGAVQEGKTGQAVPTGRAVPIGQVVQIGQMTGTKPKPEAKNGTAANASKALADSLAAPLDIAFLPAEYQKKKEQIAGQIRKASGRIPEEMEAVFGKLPLIQLVEESEETAEYVSRMLYEMPEMEIYTKWWQEGTSGEQPEGRTGAEKAGKTQPKAAKILVELIETLSPKEWGLVEQQLLRKAKEAGEKGKIRAEAGLGNRAESLRGSGAESVSGNVVKFLEADEKEPEAGVENLPAMSKLEYRNMEKFLLWEKDMAGSRYQESIPFAAAALRLNLPDTVSLEFLKLISQDFRSGSQMSGSQRISGSRQPPVNRQPSGSPQMSGIPQTYGSRQPSRSLQISESPQLSGSPQRPESPQLSGSPQVPESPQLSGSPRIPESPQSPDMLLLSAAADGRGEEGALVTSGVSNDMAGYPGAQQVFKEERLYTMLQESGIYAADRVSSKGLQNFRTPESLQDFGLPIPDRIIARTMPPKGMESPVRDAKTQLRFLQEQPEGKFSEEDIHTVQVMGNKVRTANEYEERLTKLTEQITAQKAEIDELMQNHRKLSDPRRQQRIVERMMKQLRGQLKLERLQRGND